MTDTKAMWSTGITSILQRRVEGEDLSTAQTATLEALRSDAAVASWAAFATVDMFASERHETVRRIAATETRDRDETEHLTDRAVAHLAALRDAFHGQPRETVTGPAGDMLWADEVFISHLGTIGPRGAELAGKLARVRREAWAAHVGQSTLAAVEHAPGAIWSVFDDPELGNKKAFVSILVRAVYHDEVKGLAALDVPTFAGWAKMEKGIVALAPVFGPETGASGPEMAESLEGYGYAPGFMAQVEENLIVVPKSSPLLQPKKDRPHQRMLPIGRVEENGKPDDLVLMPAVGPGGVGMLTAKLAILANSSSAFQAGRVVTDSAGSWTKRIMPRARGNNGQPRDRLRVAQAFAEAGGLVVINPAKSTMYRMFSCAVPITAKASGNVPADAKGAIGYDSVFKAHHWRRAIGKSFHGQVLVNLRAVMEMDNRKAALLRLYLRATGLWNAAFKPSGAFDPAMLPGLTADELGALANVFSPRVVRYLTGQGVTVAEAVDTRKERAQVKQWLEELEGLHLVTLSKVGKARIKVLPPDEYAEIQKAFRSGRARPWHGWK